MKKNLFIQEFFKNWREVGSVTPSSRFLVNKMLTPVDFNSARVIVELGPGSGCVTREILKRMRPDARLLVFESNYDFCCELEKINDSRMLIYNKSALLLPEYLGGLKADSIVSGIPLAMLSSGDKDRLLFLVYENLKQNGRYVQFQYSLESRKNLEYVFDGVTINFTPFNIPPAFVYTCVKDQRIGDLPVLELSDKS